MVIKMIKRILSRKKLMTLYIKQSEKAIDNNVLILNNELNERKISIIIINNV